MKKTVILAACCLLAASSLRTVRGEGKDERMLRIVSPVKGISLRVRDCETGEEQDLILSADETAVYLPKGHEAEIAMNEQMPGWIAETEMPWPLDAETDTFALPLHPLKAMHQLHTDKENHGEFRFAVSDEKGNRLAEWKIRPDEAAVTTGFLPLPGSTLNLTSLSVPEGFVRNETRIQVPLFLKEEEWIFSSEAVPFAEKTIAVIPAQKNARLTFSADREDTEAAADAQGNPAEYVTDEEGKFTAVLARGTYFISGAEGIKGYYPLQKEEFFFDTDSENLQVMLKAVSVHVRLQSEDILPADGEIILYEGEEEIGRLAAAEDIMIPSAWLEAGNSYTAVLNLPDAFVCEDSRREFSVPDIAPDEDPIISFEVQKAVLPLRPQPDPALPAEETEKEEKEKEKTEVKAVPVFMQRSMPEMAENIRPQVPERQDARGFSVILKDMAGKALSGAVLRVENTDGETIAQWVSGSGPHRVENSVIPGDTYAISQQTAVNGYEKLQMKILFTMPADSTEEPLVVLQNRALENAVIRDEPLKLPRTGLYVSTALACASLLAAAVILAGRRHTAEK